MDFKKVLNEIQSGKTKPVYLILGNQNYLADQIKRAFVNIIPEDQRSMNIGIYDMEDTPISSAVEDAISLPFFGDQRLVIINNPYFLTGIKSKSKIEHNLDDFLNYLNHPEKSTILVIFAPYEKLDSRKKVTKALKKVASVVEIGRISEATIRSTVQSTLKSKGFSIDEDALDRLIQLTAGDLTTMMNELPKLMIYSNTSKKISLTAVSGLVSRSMEQNVFDLVNQVLAKNTRKAMEIYHQLIMDNEEPLRINAVLVQQFRLLLQVKILNRHGYSQGDLSSALKVHPYRVKMALQSVNRFNYEELKRAFLGLVEIERDLKSTNRDPELLFEVFVLKFARFQPVNN